LCSVHRHESILRDNVQANTTSQKGQKSDDQGQELLGNDYSGQSLDSSSSSFLNHQSPVSETSGASGEENEEILAAQSECDGDLHVQDCYISAGDDDEESMARLS